MKNAILIFFNIFEINQHDIMNFTLSLEYNGHMVKYSPIWRSKWTLLSISHLRSYTSNL